MAVFLGLNGLEFTASEADAVTTIVALASGDLDEETLADWIRLHTARREQVSRLLSWLRSAPPRGYVDLPLALE